MMFLRLVSVWYLSTRPCSQRYLVILEKVLWGMPSRSEMWFMQESSS